ncbi:hypothetical protein [Candidatus Brocadia sapporoensis]|nr:hypothetical protein [Candidatus Brocadia sapporoensis]MDG6006581.1 hypothetical protein [Candidatus Brocadia sp.]
MAKTKGFVRNKTAKRTNVWHNNKTDKGHWIGNENGIRAATQAGNHIDIRSPACFFDYMGDEP